MATYTLKGQRWLRKYTAPHVSPVYAAAIDAQAVVDSFCDVPWEAVAESDAAFASHSDEVPEGESVSGLDKNVADRDRFDAALFCANHSGGSHRVYANAACYRFRLPEGAIGKALSALSLSAASDPYNSGGLRIHVFTNSTGEIPMNCNTLRGNNSSGTLIEDGTTAAAAVPRTTQTSDGKDYWYPTQSAVELAPATPITLQQYLFVFIGLESYSTVRGNWCEGSGFIRNAVKVTLSAAIDGYADGADINCSRGVDGAAPYLDEGIPVGVSKVEWWTDGVCESVFFCLRRIRAGGALSVPFATWRMPTPSGLPFETVLALDGKQVPPGRYILECCQDVDGDGRLDPKEAYAASMPFTLDAANTPERVGLELTEVSPTFPRIDMEAALALMAEQAAFVAEHPNGMIAWSEAGYSEADALLIKENSLALQKPFLANSVDRGYWELPWAKFTSVDMMGHDASTVRGKSVRIRVLRIAINETSVNNGSGTLVDFYVDVEARPVMTEADILVALDSAGVLDLDWGGARTKFGGSWGNITSTRYRIVVGDGTVADDELNNLIPGACQNYFESGATQADTANLSVVTRSGRPIFRWTHENTIGKAYPAFRLRIWDGSTAVYDSGTLRAPPRDANGVYGWTLPVAVGEEFSEGVSFAANHDYKWDVSMLDAKFIQAKWEATPSHVGTATLRVDD